MKTPGTKPEESGETSVPVLTHEDAERIEAFRVEHATQMLVILFTDLVGSTQVKSEQGDLAAKALEDRHRDLLQQALSEIPSAHPVRVEGDSYIFVFLRPGDAIRFALQAQFLHREARARQSDLPEFRVGIHLGTVIVEEDFRGRTAAGEVGDIKGLQADTAARVMGLALGGQILCTRAVFDDARQVMKGTELANVGTLRWLNHGPYSLKGRDDTLDVCEVGEDGTAPFVKPAGNEKAKPADRVEEELGWRPAVGVIVPNTDWTLSARLGEGAFGEAWLAEKPRSREKRVFKFCFKKANIALLKREGLVLGRLKTRMDESEENGRFNIVRYEDFAVTQEQPPYYVAMEYVPGLSKEQAPTLAAWLATRPALPERLEVMAQVADGLQFAHGVGVLHRDVKPSNILVTRTRVGAVRAKLIDFGLATADRDFLASAYLSRLDASAGTPRYMAPELARGETATAGADLYSLGVTLYQVVAGDLDRPMVSGWQRDVSSPVLRADIEQATDQDPARRWESPATLAAALRKHEERLRLHEAQIKAKRLRNVVSAAAVLLTVVGIGGGVAIHNWRVAETERVRATNEWMRAETERMHAAEARECAEEAAYDASILLAVRQMAGQDNDAALHSLMAAPERLRNWEWRHLMERACPYAYALGSSTNPVLRFDFSPDGELLLTDEGQCGTVRDSATGEVVSRLVSPSTAETFRGRSFCLNGTAVIASSSNRVCVWSAQSGSMTQTIDLGEGRGYYSEITCSPDGAYALLNWGYGRDAVLLDARAPGRVLRIFKDERPIQERSEPFRAGFSRDGTALALANPDRIVNLPGGEIRCPLVPEEDGSVTVRMMFSPDGEYVLVFRRSNQSWVSHDTVQGTKMFLYRSGSGQLVAAGAVSAEDACFGHSGRILLASGNQLEESEPTHAGTFSNHYEGAVGLQLQGEGYTFLNKATFAAAGTRLIGFQNGRPVCVWDTCTGTELLNMGGSSSGLTGMRMDRRGRYLASPSGERLFIWDMEQSKKASLGVKGTGVVQAFGADGEKVLSIRRSWQAVSTDIQTGQHRVATIEEVNALRDERRRHDRGQGDSYSRLTGSVLLGRRDARGFGIWSETDGNLIGGTYGMDLVRHVELNPNGGLFGGDGALVVAGRVGARVFYDSMGVVGSFPTPILADTTMLRLFPDAEGTFLGAHFSPDGRWVAAWTSGLAGAQDRVYVWDRETGDVRTYASFDGHGTYVEGLRFSSDSLRVASWDFSHVIKVWDVATRREICAVSNANALVAGFSPDGMSLMTGGFKGIDIYDAHTGKLRALCPATNKVGTTSGDSYWSARMEVTSDEHFALLTSDSEFLVVNLRERTSVCRRNRIPGSLYMPRLIGFGSDGSHVIDAAWGWSPVLTDTRSGELLQGYETVQDPLLAGLVATNTSRIVCVASRNVFVWDTKSERLLSTIPIPGPIAEHVGYECWNQYGPNVCDISLAPDEGRIAISDSFGHLLIVDLETGQCSHFPQNRTTEAAVWLSPSWDRLVAIETNGCARIDRLDGGGSSLRIPRAESSEGKAYEYDRGDVCFSRDGMHITIRHGDNALTVVDAAGTRRVARFSASTWIPPSGSVFLGPDGTVMWRSEGTGLVCADLRTGSYRWRVDGDFSELAPMSVSPDLSRLVIAEDRRGVEGRTGEPTRKSRIVVLDTRRGRRMLELGESFKTEETPTVTPVFSSNGNMILTGPEDIIGSQWQKARVWCDLRTDRVSRLH